MAKHAVVQAVETDLVGKVIKPRHETDIRDSSGRPSAWPVNEPNLSNEHIATVMAVWVDRDGELKLMAASPKGHLFEVYASHVNLLPH